MISRTIAAIAAVGLISCTVWAQDAPKLSDSQIAHIAYTAGVIDIEAAKQALARSKTKAVLDFASGMLRDHEAVNKQALDLVAKLKVTPEDNETSRALAKAASEKRAALAKLTGGAFDKAYIDNEIAYHQQVNGALSTVLIPSASNPGLKELLQTGLKLFQGHEQHAVHVAADIKQDDLP